MSRYGHLLLHWKKFRRSPLPQGGLEISITLTIFNTADACSRICDKKQELVKEYYKEPEHIIEDENEDIFYF